MDNATLMFVKAIYQYPVETFSYEHSVSVCMCQFNSRENVKRLSLTDEIDILQYCPCSNFSSTATFFFFSLHERRGALETRKWCGVCDNDVWDIACLYKRFTVRTAHTTALSFRLAQHSYELRGHG